jgi:type IV pilus assembly protein PilE
MAGVAAMTALTAMRHTRAPICRGWSLIELLLALCIAGLLTQWALPSAAEWVQRTRRNEARLALLQTAHWLERYAAARGRYPDTLPDSAWSVPSQSYRLSYSVAAVGQRYTLLAIPQGGQAADPCGMLSLDQAGARGVRLASWSAQTCWSR